MHDPDLDQSHVFPNVPSLMGRWMDGTKQLILRDLITITITITMTSPLLCEGPVKRERKEGVGDEKAAQVGLQGHVDKPDTVNTKEKAASLGCCVEKRSALCTAKPDRRV